MDKGVFSDHRETEQTTLSEILDRYEREILPSKKSQFPVKGQIKRIIGTHSLVRLTTSVIAEFRDIRINKISSETTQKELLLIRKVLKTAIIDRGIHLPNGNSVMEIRLLKPCTARERRLNFSKMRPVTFAGLFGILS